MTASMTVQLDQALDGAVRAVPPAWPLAATVAVNPFLGQGDRTLAQTAACLGRVAGIQVTLPRERYAAKVDSGQISDEDLLAALAAAPEASRPGSLTALKEALRRPGAPVTALPTIAELAAEESGIDWPGLIAERIGAWAAGFFDEGQALWAAPKERGAYSAWRAAATHDLTPEILGLKGFARHVAESPQRAEEAIARAVERLGLEEGALPTYLHALLMTMGGWSHLARQKLWQAELAGAQNSDARELLAIRLVWEEALFEFYDSRIAAEWSVVRNAHSTPLAPSSDQILDSILQEAAERAGQRQLAAILAAPEAKRSESRPALQAAFCIDVRSEVYRRALESVDPGIQTLGFAGFFGLATAHRRFASDVEERRLPVLLNPGVASVSGSQNLVEADLSARFAARAKRAWGRFKLAAVSSFAFVEAAGPIYAVRLIRDSLGLKPAVADKDPAPRLDPALGLEQQIGAAEAILRAMSLTRDFAPLILIAGHGAKVVNNPHASALHCGACGGYSGEVNARLLALLLNNSQVRTGLKEKGIEVPDDTLFLAALHDTTGDTVRLYSKDVPSAARKAALRRAEAWLESAAKIARGERALRLPRAAGAGDITRRSRDWSETRPEWALAGCKAFIAAPRSRTLGKGLAGRAFLHDYIWKDDKDFGVLELIMTAPVVVASWISLQYYGSTVAPETFGGGNKLLHNVIGGIGVVEGNGGNLRPGLPWQSVHDGEKFAHEPLRLSVYIEAPREAMTDILRNHPGVRDLFDKGWLTLFAMGENGAVAWRYREGLTWDAVETTAQLEPTPQAA